MTLRQLLLAAGILGATVFLLIVFQPRRAIEPVRASAEPDTGSMTAPTAPADRALLIVRVDGTEAIDPALSSSTPLAYLPLENITSSMVSHVRSSGNFQTLVLVDGSEVPLSSRDTERLPGNIQYRVQYDRDAR